VLKHQLIPERTAWEAAFWKCGQTDRTKDRHVHWQ